tara:strand:+ start:117 stop:365 length:249 start_codon:yes stop_codon:yes gene_type:complete
MKKQKTIEEIVLNSFKRVEKLEEKIYWLDIHMNPREKYIQKKLDWRYSKFLAFPKYKRAVTQKEARGEIKPIRNNIITIHAQ